MTYIEIISRCINQITCSEAQCKTFEAQSSVIGDKSINYAFPLYLRAALSVHIAFVVSIN